jgi:hypothetical protein
VKKNGTDSAGSVTLTCETTLVKALTTLTNVTLQFDLINNDFKSRNLLMFNSIFERF